MGILQIMLGIREIVAQFGLPCMAWRITGTDLLPDKTARGAAAMGRQRKWRLSPPACPKAAGLKPARPSRATLSRTLNAIGARHLVDEENPIVRLGKVVNEYLIFGRRMHCGIHASARGGGDERYMENEGGSRKSGREKRRLYEREVGPIIGGMFVIGRQQSSRAYKTPRQR